MTCIEPAKHNSLPGNLAEYPEATRSPLAGKAVLKDKP
jgi:hypothetical protein